MRTSYDAQAVALVINDLARRIVAGLDTARPLVVVGIRTRGHTLADRLVPLLAPAFSHIERGILDITLHRDDLSEIGPRPLVRPTRIDADISAKTLLLVDDVLFTGRSVRAALDALADFGRPAAIRLAVLVDRGGRELPIQPDFVGIRQTDVSPDHKVKVMFSENDPTDGISVEPRAGPIA